MKQYQSQRKITKHTLLYTPLTKEDIEKQAILDFFREIPLEDIKKICTNLDIKELDPETASKEDWKDEYYANKLNRLAHEQCYEIHIKNLIK